MFGDQSEAGLQAGLEAGLEAGEQPESSWRDEAIFDELCYQLTVDADAGYSHDANGARLPHGFDLIPPGPLLAAALAGVDRSKLNGFDLVRTLQARAASRAPPSPIDGRHFGDLLQRPGQRQLAIGASRRALRVCLGRDQSRIDAYEEVRGKPDVTSCRRP